MLQVDPLALLILLGLGVFIYWFYQHRIFNVKQSSLLYSSLKIFKLLPKTARESFLWIPPYFYICGLGFLLLAFLNPHSFILDDSKRYPKEGLALFFVLDRSGSMNRIVDQEWRATGWKPITQFEALKKITQEFIAKTPNDLIGVVAFARTPEILSPLTLEHQELNRKIQNLQIIKDPEQDGTAIGYAIYKTAHLFSTLQTESQSDTNPPYQIKSAVMILVTDGLQDPSILDRGNRLRTTSLEEAGQFIRKNNIHLYILHIGNLLNDEQYAPNKREFEKLADTAGGRLIVVDHPNALSEIFKSIERLEKSKIYQDGQPHFFKKILYYPYLISLGLILIGLSIFLRSTLWRRTL